MKTILNKNYHIERIENSEYSYLIYSHNHLDPFEEIDEISKKINCNECVILFDLLLKNGSKKDRFYSVKYSNKKFNFNTITHITDIPETIKMKCSEYYYYNQQLLEHSILPNPLIFLIRKGRVI